MRRTSTHQSGAVHAFTLVEMMVAVAVSMVIIISLYGVFNHTQKAFRSSVNQVDILEGGRATMDIIANDFRQMAPSGITGVENFLAVPLSRSPEIIGELAGQTVTNVFQETLFLTRPANKAGFIGYRFHDPEGVGIATLMRYTYTTNFSKLKTWGSSLSGPVTLGFFAAPELIVTAGTNNISGSVPVPGFQKVLDGVVHFRLVPYDAAGKLLTITNLSSSVSVTNDFNTAIPSYYFSGDQVPAFIDVELGILSPEVVSRVEVQPSPVREDLFNRSVGNIHLFRERIAIRPQL